MPIGWFLAPYKRTPGPEVGRYCAMDDFTTQIWADNGWPNGCVLGSPKFWSESEGLGDCAVVKVKASAATLAAINAEPNFFRIPVAHLDDPLSSLSPAQRTALRNRVQALGYPLSEIQARFPSGDLGNFTLGDVLRFILSRRLAARYDPVDDTIYLDGVELAVRPLEHVDSDVSE